MIDEEKLIQDLRTYRDKSHIPASYSLLENLITIQPRVGEWILVTEGLPEKSKTVLLSSPQFPVVQLGNRNGENSWHVDAFPKKSEFNITAWMPLPEPYGGE